MSDIVHGLSAYNKKGCRCVICREAKRAYRANYLLDPSKREAKRAANRAWRKANPEAKRAYDRTYNRKRLKKSGDREADRARVRAWRKANPEKSRMKWQRYRARKLDQFIEDVDRLVLAERDGWICGICLEAIEQEVNYPNPLSLSVDHIIALSKGGEHSYNNTQPAHLVCNTKKGVGLRVGIPDRFKRPVPQV